MRTADIFIDTSIKGPRRRKGKYLYIVGIQEETRYRQSNPQTEQIEDTTENQLTLTALEKALSHFKKPFHLSIYIECSYVANAIEQDWPKKWSEGGWLTARGIPVADSEKWQKIQQLLNQHEFEIHCKSHHSFREWMEWTLKEA